MPIEQLRHEIARALGEMGVAISSDEIVLERPRNPEHGDLASNVAMALARSLKRPPRQIAEELLERLDLRHAGLTSAEIAGPGFINFRLSTSYFFEGLREIVARGDTYGRSDTGRGEKIMVEFVSANPTGPLHIGHGRQTALGDAISELLAWTGWNVYREFYYNDAGEQITRLTRSVWARYQQHFGRDVPFPEDGYHGSYVVDIARDLAEKYSDAFLDDESPETLDTIRRYAVAELRRQQNEDLDLFRVHFDNFYLESSLYTDGRVDETIRRLKETGLTYEHEGALWLRTTAFGDDKDRVMVKSSGHPTYFLPDVAYHITKWERGFHKAINVQGSDHHGTVARVKAGLQALGLPADFPEYVLHQMVTFVRGGEEVKFSKRAGDAITLRELADEIGVDVARYFYLMRRADAQLTFDLDLARDQSEKNPVYKAQYAHARMSSIFRRAGIEDPAKIDVGQADLALLTHPTELDLVKLLLRFPETVETAAQRRAPHMICEYVEEVSGAVNSWYHAGNLDPSLRVLGVDEALSNARLVLARAIQIVLRNGLAVLGVTAPTRMERDPAAA